MKCYFILWLVETHWYRTVLHRLLWLLPCPRQHVQKVDLCASLFSLHFLIELFVCYLSTLPQTHYNKWIWHITVVSNIMPVAAEKWGWVCFLFFFCCWQDFRCKQLWIHVEELIHTVVPTKGGRMFKSSFLFLPLPTYNTPLCNEGFCR